MNTKLTGKCPRTYTTLIISSVYTSYLTIRNVSKHNGTISLKCVPFIANQRQRRCCYRPKNL